MNKDSEQSAVGLKKSNSTIGLGRQSSQQMSFLHSLCHGSSGPGNSSRHQRSSLENKDSEQDIVEVEKSDSIIDLGRQSSQRMSLLRSISHGSYRLGNSSRHFGVSFGLPTGLNFPETALAEARAKKWKIVKSSIASTCSSQ